MSCVDDWDFRCLQSIVDQLRNEIERLKRKYEELDAKVDGMKK